MPFIGFTVLGRTKYLNGEGEDGRERLRCENDRLRPRGARN